MVLEIDGFDAISPSKRPRRRHSRLAFAGRLVVATAMLGGVWLFAAASTVSSFAPSFSMPVFSMPERPDFAIMLPKLPGPLGMAEPEKAADPVLKINKFSRLYQAPAAPKATRLEGAHLAAIEAKRPEPDMLASALETALATAAREERFAALADVRPQAELVRQMIDEAMNQTVALAPRVERAAPAVTTASIPVPQPVEEALSDESAIELAAIEAEEAGRTAEVAALMDDTLPTEGPLPIARPQTAAAALEAMAVAKLAKPQRRGKLAPVEEAEEPSSAVLAYAKPDNPVKPSVKSVPWPDIGTTKVAVYDISNGVVHMPDGTKLEAHSGIGKMRDNPKYTHVKMKGPTPPGTFKLSMREKLFHGVAAIRLTSVDGKHPQGRTGLLAHSYLLRSRPGDSHGCVAFKHYDKFLAAYRRGEITHMVIVPEYDGRGPGKSNNLLAKLFGGRNG